MPAGVGSSNDVVSWHEMQASALGAVFQRSACAPAWHLSQRAMFAAGSVLAPGNATVEKSCTELAKPMIWYGWPASTLGSVSPRWILWIMTLKSTVLPDCGSIDCGW